MVAARLSLMSMEQPMQPGEFRQPEKEKILLEWQAPSRPHRKNGQFLTLPMVIGILVGLILLFIGEWMLIAVIAALVFAYYTWTVIPADVVSFKLTNIGVRINEERFPWQALTRWWITEKWGQKIVAIEIPAYVSGRLFLPIGEESMEKIEAVMNSYLLKETPPETGMEKLGKWMSEKFPLEEKI